MQYELASVILRAREWSFSKQGSKKFGTFTFPHLPETLDIQNPPVIPGEDWCLELLKAEPEEKFYGVWTPTY